MTPDTPQQLEFDFGEKEKCGKCAEALIPRWGMYRPCEKPRGHFGECVPGGECFAHGYYLGYNCPYYPKCIEILMKRELQKTCDQNT